MTHLTFNIIRKKTKWLGEFTVTVAVDCYNKIYFGPHTERVGNLWDGSILIFYADVLVIKKLNMSIIIFIDYFNSKKIYVYP